jgi:pimeloyl-ACP methyl ester carboxylesterase
MRIEVNGTTLFVDVDGAKVVASESGWVDRPTVVLLHPGPGADHSLFKDVSGPRLAEVAQVVYVDQRGDGRSDRASPASWNLETWAEDLRCLLEVLEIERPVLFGASVGALVALTLASRHPDLPSRLVLTSAVARYVHARSIAEFDRLGGSQAGETAARYFAAPSEATWADYIRDCLPLYTRTGIDPEVVARMQMNPAATINWDAVESKAVDLRETVKSIRRPVFLLAGEDDPSFTMTGAEELAEALPESVLTFRRYENAGHGVVRDRRDALEDIVAFVTG